MDIIVNREEFNQLQEYNENGYNIFIDIDGEFTLDIETSEELDVHIRLLFQYDMEDENIRIYTNGLEDGLRYELLAIFTAHDITFELE